MAIYADPRSRPKYGSTYGFQKARNIPEILRGRKDLSKSDLSRNHTAYYYRRYPTSAEGRGMVATPIRCPRSETKREAGNPLRGNLVDIPVAMSIPYLHVSHTYPTST